MKDINNITSIDIDFVDDNGVTHFDGYFINEDEEGLVMAYGIGGEVYYCNPEYRYFPLMIDAVNDYKNSLCNPN